ncbi:MAG TPA: hypothetical protein VLH39_05750 [Magnetospirillaceae bacterium]|nr:hypothetical protein [Magnetospirillaceae bacterium]
MKMGEFQESLRELLDSAERLPLDLESRIVILSDLHLGDGSAGDDFLRNEQYVLAALRSWYLPRGYLLVLNGDIEDLQKAAYPRILASHKEFYSLLDAFAAEGLLRKILGNHDLGLLLSRDLRHPVVHAICLEWRGRSFLVYHGHQASKFFVRYNYLSRFVVRYLANPLRLKNVDIPMTSRRRFRAERRIYRASRALGIVSVTGHTHRPLFESLSKYDTLRYKLEDLIRRYAEALEADRAGIAELAGVYDAEMKRLDGKERGKRSQSLYETEDTVLPYLFNSGCATGVRGFTALEIGGGSIRLSYWADGRDKRPYVDLEASEREALEGTTWVRYVLKEDRLDYVTSRIDLLR